MILYLSFFVALLQKEYAIGWTPISTKLRTSRNSNGLQSTTPFGADYYGKDDGTNPFLDDVSPSAVSPDTKLVLGLNKYSHDTSLCAADAATGEVLFAMSKERLTRRKHDAGNVALLVDKCLECLNLNLDAIERVVINNHHHRVLTSTEANRRHMEWEAGLSMNGGSEDGYDDDENLLPDASRHEMSHHLAHAYSTATQSPFDRGMICVMDGMGETYRAMKLGQNDESYTSDFDISSDIQLMPSDLHEQETLYDWREAESIYTFSKTKNGIDIVPIFKRFQKENSPPTLYNHGFENMDSLGALYSRVSSHIFGDWNACGKVMGLAPWKVHTWEDGTIVPTVQDKPTCWGSLYKEYGAIHIDRTLLEGLPLISRNDPELFDPETMVRRRRYDFDDDDYQPVADTKKKGKDDLFKLEDIKIDEKYEETPPPPRPKQLPAKVALDAIGLAARMQQDLEEIALDFVSHFKQETGETNLCVAGGVGLNSVLNGRLARDLGFSQTYISPYPGDDGIAVGCCAFALYDPKQETKPPIWKEPLSPYLGPLPTDLEIKDALEAAKPWLDIETVWNEELRIDLIVSELDKGSVVALYQGRSEMGPRALGHRSILADPRQKPMVRFINEKVKKRESFRPFAPSVLVDEVNAWFDLGEDAAADEDNNLSPYMSMTAMVKESQRKLIPAVTHVDGSSRLQTVTPDSDPFYYDLIKAFFKQTNVPMVLNTSFNTIPGEPIVESPKDAIASFLHSMRSIDLLVMGNYVIRRREPDIALLLGQGTKSTDGEETNPSFADALCPKRAGPVEFEAKFSLKQGKTDDEEVDTLTRVRMPDRIMHHDEKDNWHELVDELEGEILSICDGTNTINDILAFFTTKPLNEEYEEEDVEDSSDLVQQVLSRVYRLHENTFLSW